MKLTEVRAGTYNSAYMLQAEADEIEAQCLARGAEADLQFDKDAVGLPMIPDRLGLALSGGGVRSASIAVGILQGMARSRMLNQVHYVSAISGGGYALAWLTAWSFRQKSLRAVEDCLAHNTASGVPANQALPPRYARHVEPFPLHYLRRYTSYLTPRAGLLSGDMLSMVSIYMRNALLNFAMLACVAITLMLTLQAPAFLNSVDQLGGIFLGHSFLVVVAMFGAAVLFGTAVIAQSLYRLMNRQEQEWLYAGHAAVACGVASCTFLWLLLPRWYATYASPRWTATAVGLLSILVANVTVFFNRSPFPTSVERRRAVQATVYLLAWSVVGFMGYLIESSVRAWIITGPYVAVRRSYGVLGLPALLFAMSLISYVWVGIASIAMGGGKRDWLARVAGYLLAASVLVALLFGIAFYGPLGMHLILTAGRIESWKKWVVGLVLPGGWLFTVLAGLISAGSKITDGTATRTRGVETTGAFTLPVFLLGVMMVASWGSSRLVSRTVSGCMSNIPCVHYLPWEEWAPEKDQPAKLRADPIGVQRYETAVMPQRPIERLLPGSSLQHRYMNLLLLFGLFAGLLSLAVDANESSQHLFYRNRLVRVFLGASRPDNKEQDGQDPRDPSPFTGFAPDDDIFLSAMTCDRGFQGPYPIWGTCLSLTTGKDLGWRERRGASFLYSPLFCGWDYVNWFSAPKESEGPDVDADEKRDVRSKDRFSTYGYRSTRPSKDSPADKGRVVGYGGDGGSPLLGTAMASSGVPISPQWTSRGQPWIAALRAMFNLRLGWWVGNPRHPDTWKSYGPPIGYQFMEWLGLIDSRSKYLYLSDGGNFENLGLYELVRRRVRFIICSDADADPGFAFGNLGDAIDHCRRDFGVEIRINAQQSIAAGKVEGFRESHYALGTIMYPGQQATGLLLYIKSSLTTDEPGDVLGMKAQKHDFPHDTTLNPSLNERMFESYRALGQHMFDSVMESSRIPGTGGTGDESAVADTAFQRCSARGVGPSAGPGPGDSVRELFVRLVEQRDKPVAATSDITNKVAEPTASAASSSKPAAG